MRCLAPFGLLLVIAVCAISSIPLWPHALSSPGIDLFRFWAIGAVHKAYPGQLGSPYLAPDEYAAALKQLLAVTEQTVLARIANVSLPFDLTATPLLYYMHALAPADYLTFLTRYRLVQIASAWIAVSIIGMTRSGHWIFPLIFAALLCLAYDPLLLDVNVGNTNALQLLAMTCVTVLLTKLRHLHRFSQVGIVLMLAVILLFKPTLTLSALLLIWVVFGKMTPVGRVTWAFGVALSTVLLALLPCLYFGTWGVWLDWYRELTSNALRISYPMSAGNFSTTSYLAKELNVTILLAAAAIGGGLLCTIGLLLPRSVWFPTLSADANGGHRLYLAVSFGLIVTLALSPLVWQHYLVLLLFPVVYLLFERSSSRSVVILASLSLLLCLGFGRRIFSLHLGIPLEWVELSNILAWVPAWFALLLSVRAMTFCEELGRPLTLIKEDGGIKN